MIEILSRQNIIKLLQSKELDSICDNNYVVISVSTVESGLEPICDKHPDFDTEFEMIGLLEEHLSNKMKAFLTLNFLDTIPSKFETGSIYLDYLFTEDHANKVALFVEKHKELDFIIHCTAGISRSAAIADYVSIVKEEHELLWRRYGSKIKPNVWVQSLLKRRLWNV